MNMILSLSQQISRKITEISFSSRIVITLIYVSLVSTAIYTAFANWAYDDPFITYRYARNLASGLGFLYNPGERVLSTTTPLFTVLLALLENLWPDLPRLANLIGAIGLALGGIFLWDLGRSWKTPAVGWAGLLLYPTFLLLLSTLGSETNLYLAFCIGAIACYARRCYTWTAVCAALAVLTRPDGALVALILVTHYTFSLIYQRKRSPRRQQQPVVFPWRAMGLFFGLTLPWFLFAWWYFGSPIPATLAAKQLQGTMATSEQFGPGFITIARNYAGMWTYQLEALLALLGLIYAGWKARRWFLFLSWPAIYFLAYSLLGVSRYYWYYAPLVPGFVVMVGLGISFLVHLLNHIRNPQLQPVFPTATINNQTVFVAALLLPLVFFRAPDLWRLWQQPDPRHSIYREVGEWLQANTGDEASVGTLEVGIIGYYSQRKMVDFSGLIQPEIAAQLTDMTTFEDAALWALERYQPDYLILHENSFPRLEQEDFFQKCRLLHTIGDESYGYKENMLIYGCTY